LYLLVVRGSWPVSVTRRANPAGQAEDTERSRLVSPLATAPIHAGDRFDIGACQVVITWSAAALACAAAETAPVPAPSAGPEPPPDTRVRAVEPGIMTYTDLAPGWLDCSAMCLTTLEVEKPLEVLVTLKNVSEQFDMTYFVSARLRGIDEWCSHEAIRVNRQPRLLMPGSGDSDQVTITLRHLRHACQPAGAQMLLISIECLRDNAPTGMIEVPIEVLPYEHLDIRH
jgi:hypothetical protein